MTEPRLAVTTLQFLLEEAFPVRDDHGQIGQAE
jgi:hypothetical protein